MHHLVQHPGVDYSLLLIIISILLRIVFDYSDPMNEGTLEMRFSFIIIPRLVFLKNLEIDIYEKKSKCE